MEQRTIDLLIGGFGALNGEHSPGIEHYQLQGDPSQLQDDPSEVPGVRQVTAAGITLSRIGVLAELPSPGWLVRHGRMLYATLEHSDEIATLELSGSHGSLQARLISRIASAGREPTHVVVVADATGGLHLVVANYRNGVIGVHPIDETGRALEATQALLGEGRGPKPAQDGPHAHWSLPLPDGRLLTTDLGADRVYVHRWQGDELVRTGSVIFPPGTGPRDLHLLPGSDGSWHVAVVGEWGNTVSMLEHVESGRSGQSGQSDLGQSSRSDQSGQMVPTDQHGDGLNGHALGNEGIRIAQTVDLGGDEDKDQAASLAFVGDTALASGSSGFAYVGLRGSDRIVTLRWDGARLCRCGSVDDAGWKGRGVSSGGGRPRQIRAIGHSLIVANETSDSLAMFAIEQDGEPRALGAVAAGSPTSVLPW